MRLDPVVQQICQRDFWDFTPDDIDVLANLPPADYAEVIRQLLAMPVRTEELTGLAYRAAYRCRVTGCVLFTMWPQPPLYDAILQGAFGIADPTSIKHGAAALVQVRPTPRVALDVVHATFDLRPSDWLIERSLSLLYWIGFTPRGLQQQRMPEVYAPPITALWIERSRPLVSSDEALHAAHDIASFILDQFEQHGVGAIAHASIALLTFLRPEEYPNDLATRIIHAYRRAHISPDDFVRGRVQSPRIQALIEANEE
jgi:hypothetical protein